ncbi:MAG: XTP/dITP diphosphatase [candidate division KSB1 bacterium]|nr:XTP/dITP diphosphatase [candidate division KSB1 bacterium]MDZ7301460.1 XTP/dITP diphosphatase [candidate division KSB1 bacterium]MDZ7310862.1 XTP/dITP diphosphatase [candidate division KSB1 bacterium]
MNLLKRNDATLASTIVLATRNEHKVIEIRDALAGMPIQISSLLDFPDAPELAEDGKTLEANATKKALTIHRYTNLPTIADDTGLMVEALNGVPGVYSSRFAGPHATYADNVEKLLRLLEGIPSAQRTAEFRTVIAFALNGKTHLVDGRCRGLITFAPRGRGGFGYDPVFLVPELNKTLAELTLAEKNQISHRGRALVAFKALLSKLQSDPTGEQNG